MFGLRTHCALEQVAMPGAGGLLMLDDALSCDLSAWHGQVQCVYLDPPSVSGDQLDMSVRIGQDGWSGGRAQLSLPAYRDFAPHELDAYLDFLRQLIIKARFLLKPEGSLFLHTDWRTAHHARLLLDELLGPAQFRNDIVWSYQTGGRAKRFFSRKHDTILFYAKSASHVFDITQVPAETKKDRKNNMKRSVDASGRSYRSIQSGGKTYIYYDDEPSYPDDVWADVSQMQQKDPQRTGYPSQKPQSLMERIILCCTKPGDLVADLTCGSGTTLFAAASHGRRFLGVDNAPQAYAVCRKRLSGFKMTCKAPTPEFDAQLDCGLMTGIGFYTVSLRDYYLPDQQLDLAKWPNDKPVPSGLDLIDQWHAGLIQNGEFTVYSASARTRQTPQLEGSLDIPLLRGQVALLTIDIFGNRSLWTLTGGI